MKEFNFQIVKSRSDAVSFVRGTLFGIQTKVGLDQLIDEAIAVLLSNGLIAEKNVWRSVFEK